MCTSARLDGKICKLNAHSAGPNYLETIFPSHNKFIAAVGNLCIVPYLLDFCLLVDTRENVLYIKIGCVIGGFFFLKMTTFAFTHKLPDDRLRKKSTQNFHFFRFRCGGFCIFDLEWILACRLVRYAKDPKADISWWTTSWRIFPVTFEAETYSEHCLTCLQCRLNCILSGNVGKQTTRLARV